MVLYAPLVRTKTPKCEVITIFQGSASKEVVTLMFKPDSVALEFYAIAHTERSPGPTRWTAKVTVPKSGFLTDFGKMSQLCLLMDQVN